MALIIKHKGIQFNAQLDQTGFTSDVNYNAQLPSVTGLVSGCAVAIGPNGVHLADAAAGDVFAGFIINDAAGYFMENKPALASGIVPISLGNQVVATDRILTTDVFNPGDKVYLGSGGNKGLLTKEVPVAGNITPVGIAASSASAAAPLLSVIVF
jgi:hypothetical protein